MNIKACMYSLCLVAELVLFMYVYIQGEHGLFAVRKLACECAAIEKSCTALQDAVVHLDEGMRDWEQYPFYRECFARENLHMGYPQEEWFRYEE